MPKTKKRTRKNKKQASDYWLFAFHKHTYRVLLNKVLFLRFLKKVEGRFWGLTAITGMLMGFSVCLIIRPDLIDITTAFSDFGNDVRTAPYFAGSVFFGAYGLWRWRLYLAHTWKRTMPVTGLITLTIIGLYLTALMPISWRPVPYYIHLFGVSLAGVSMLATVIIDGLLSNTKKSSSKPAVWKGLRLVSVLFIVLGGWLTIGSVDLLGWYDVALLGESLLLAGYFIWIFVKTYQGQGRRTLLSKLLKDFVLID